MSLANFIADILKKDNHTVTVAHCDTITAVDMYDATILGTGIYSGRWLPAAETFLRRLMDDLRDKPLFYYLVCIRLLEKDSYGHVMREYVPEHLVNQLRNIQGKTAFAGKLEYNEIDWRERWTLAVRYDGEHDPLDKFMEDHRDWNIIQQWGETVATQLKSI